jgi:hypothetical protein
MHTIDIQKRYDDVCQLMQPGDVIAFGGVGLLSDLVKRTTSSTVSHVGVIQKAAAAGNDVMVIEATVREDLAGGGKTPPTWRVGPASCRAVISHYERDVWWLPLDPQKRAQSFDQNAFDKFLTSMAGRPFDVLGGGGVILKAPIRKLLNSNILDGGDDQKLLFCSELVAAALQASKIVDDAAINPSDIAPGDLCGWTIYDRTAFRLKGTAADIPNWNSRSPSQAATTRRSLIEALLLHKLATVDPKLAKFTEKVMQLTDLLKEVRSA